VHSLIGGPLTKTQKYVLFVFGQVVPKFHYCDPTRLVCDPTKKSVHVEIEPTRSATQKKPEKSATRPDKSATLPDFVCDPGRRQSLVGSQ